MCVFCSRQHTSQIQNKSRIKMFKSHFLMNKYIHLFMNAGKASSPPRAPRPQRPDIDDAIVQPKHNNNNNNNSLRTSWLALTAGPLAADPLATDPLTADPLTDGPLATDPLAAGPLTADPLTTDPLTADPLTDGPLATGPLTADPLTADPLTDGPLTDGPLTAGPLATDPTAGDGTGDEAATAPAVHGQSSSLSPAHATLGEDHEPEDEDTSGDPDQR